MSTKHDKPDSPPEDKALFQAAVKGVRPLSQDRVVHPPSAPAARRRKTEQDDSSATRLPFSDPLALDDTRSEEEQCFKRSGLQHKLLRKLRQGRFPIDAELDLHGLRVEEARLALATLLQQAQATGARVLRIIHGKGQGSADGRAILKGHTHHWLRQHPDVLAFCPAQPGDGGSGAVYVLLRQNKARKP